MTVRDLIDHLTDMPHDAPVVVHDATGNWTYQIHLTLSIDGEVLINN